MRTEMKILGIAFIILSINSCGQGSKKDSISEKLNVKTQKIDSFEISSAIKEMGVNLKGVWGKDEIGNAYFGIYDDSIYYPDPDLWYNYELISDTIVIHGEDNTIKKIKILKLTGDSLVLFYPDYEVTDTLLKR